MKAWVPVLIVLCLLFWQRCPSHWLAWLLVYPMHIWWSRLVDSLQYLYHCSVSRSRFSFFESGWMFSLATFLYFNLRDMENHRKNTIWWSPCLKYLLLLAKCWYTDTQFLEPGDVSRTSCAPFSWNAMESPNPVARGGSGSASIFSAGFGNLIHNVPCFPFKESGLEGWTISALKNALHLSHCLDEWKMLKHPPYTNYSTIYLVCVYI